MYYPNISFSFENFEITDRITSLCVHSRWEIWKMLWTLSPFQEREHSERDGRPISGCRSQCRSVSLGGPLTTDGPLRPLLSESLPTDWSYIRELGCFSIFLAWEMWSSVDLSITESLKSLVIVWHSKSGSSRSDSRNQTLCLTRVNRTSGDRLLTLRQETDARHELWVRSPSYSSSKDVSLWWIRPVHTPGSGLCITGLVEVTEALWRTITRSN